MRSNSSRTRDRAFTLVELLVAMVITGLVSVLAYSVTTGVLNWSTRSTSDLDQARRAREVFERITADVQAMVFQPDGRVWLAVSILDRTDNSGLWASAVRQKPPGAVQLEGENLDELCFGQAGAWLRLVTFVEGTNDEASEDSFAASAAMPSAVAYQLIRRPASNGNPAEVPRYRLHRSAVRAALITSRAGSWEVGYDLNPATAGSAFQESQPGNDGSQEGDPFAVRRPFVPETIVADDIVDFGVRLLVRDSARGWTIVFPTDSSDREHTGNSIASDGEPSARFPEAMDVFVRVLTAEGARELALLESGQLVRPSLYADDSAWWRGLVNANSRWYSRRIALVARAP